MRVLVTGAAGRIGSALRPRLARPGRTLRLLDTAAQPPPVPGEAVELVAGDLTDPAAMAAACAGVRAVVHLAAIAGEAPWTDLVRVNVDGTRTLLDAACAAGVERVVLASSIQAAGFHARPGAPLPPGGPSPVGPDGLPATARPRPSTYYGVTKAAAEALGSLYADRFGIRVFAVRIGACFAAPPDGHADVWLSHDDCARLVEACLSTPATGFRLLYGISRNAGRWLSLAEGAEIGYEPVDDGATYGVAEPTGPTAGLLGGFFCELPLGRRPSP